MKSRILDEEINNFLFWVPKKREYEHNNSQQNVWKIRCTKNAISIDVNFLLWKKVSLWITPVRFFFNFSFLNFGGW